MAESKQGTSGTGDSKVRGAGFPSMPLGEAVDAVVKAGVAGGADHSRSAFATYLGHSTGNSGPFRGKVASMRDWGLITSNKERVVLTELARAFVMDDGQHLSNVERLRQAFESCSIFVKMYGDLARDVPLSKSQMRSRATMEFSVGNDSADRFVDSFMRSVETAGLGECIDNKLTLFPAARIDSDSGGNNADPETGHLQEYEPDKENGPREHETEALNRSRQPPDSSERAPIVVNQTWSLPAGGEIIFMIRSDSPLPASSFTAMAEIMTLSEKLSVALQPKAEDPELAE